jgi:hypothetical protein
MSRQQEPRDRERNDQDPPRKDVLGRILIGFIILAAVLWILTFIF